MVSNLTVEHSPIIPVSRLRRGQADKEESVPEATNGTSKGHVYIETYGCQMNVADTGMLLDVLKSQGYQHTKNANEADLILINTCAVREKAEERVYARAVELKTHKKTRPNTVLGIAGCMAEHLKEELLKRAPYVDIVAGPDSYRRMPELVNQARESKAPILDTKLDKKETYDGLSGASSGDGVSGFVSIQRGCDKFCTFCVVPYTRGREKGTSPREILRQVRAYRDAGYKEVTLLGQTVNSYRYEDINFANLLESVSTVDGIERIRFTSPYPVDFTDDVIGVIANNPKICTYVHLPVQSGSDVVLQRMKRGYSSEDFLKIVKKLRTAVPHIAISTDILTGFCGETEEDHEKTLELMKQIRFDSAFMFMYSEREMTFASKKIPDDISETTKKRRLQEIIKIQESISREIFQAHVGKTERVLLHSKSKRNENQMVGRSDGFKSVIVEGECGEPGNFVDVKIQRATMATLFGTPI